MPTYDYYCKTCDKQFEMIQRIMEPPLAECPHCGGAVQRLISPVGIIFKGSGFHVNDYRKSDTKKESETESKPAPDATPAPTPTPTPTPAAK